jgi:ribonuclease P protein component
MLAKTNRLRREGEIKRVWRFGVSFSTPGLTLRILKNKYKNSRFCIIVSNKIAKKSTARNKIKRRLREVIRLSLVNIKPGFDCLIIVRQPIVNQKYKTIKQELGNLFKRAKLL